MNLITKENAINVQLIVMFVQILFFVQHAPKVINGIYKNSLVNVHAQLVLIAMLRLNLVLLIINFFLKLFYLIAMSRWMLNLH